MKLSTKSRYGLRILTQIVVDTEDGTPVGGKEVARRQRISTAYMEQILIPLRNVGMITAVRGRNGGYLLNRDPEEITLLDVLEVFEGKLELVDGATCDHCDNMATCPTKDVWRRLSRVLQEESKSITLADLAKKMKASTSSSPEYFI
ncbi:MAG: Rrf2 family transcriptional regulator [Lentisphaeria bacterium]|nr:Rrf2 family transcriptional regulator [Lentisphaeria bacterium]